MAAEWALPALCSRSLTTVVKDDQSAPTCRSFVAGPQSPVAAGMAEIEARNGAGPGQSEGTRLARGHHDDFGGALPERGLVFLLAYL